MSDAAKSGKKSNLKTYVVVVVILALALGGFFVMRERTAEKEAKANAFRDSTIGRGDVSISIRSTGSVAPENRLEIKPPIAGRVETVLVREGERVRKSQILAWMSSTERAAVLDAAAAKGPAEVKRWEELYRSTPVLSPINGTVILRNVEPGQTFTATDAILVLSDRLTIKAQVDETDLAQVKKGLSATVTLDAYPREPIAAKVSRIAYEATTVSNVTMYVVYVTPNEMPEVMRSGMTATVKFDVASKKDVIIVANDALKTGAGGKSSVLLNVGGHRTTTDVEVGLTDGKFSEVISGLKVGDVVSARMIGEASSEKASNPFMPTPPKGARGGGARPSGGGKPGG
ncbi:efflux RND transporter periplasmic adaptor subunit [soil metagenome]